MVVRLFYFLLELSTSSKIRHTLTLKILAGLLFDKVQHWDVFEDIHELFILVPPLLGLKGNLEMTLASRLSTAANMKTLDDPKSARSIVFGNLALCQCQALVISLLVSIVAILFNWIPRGEFIWFDTLLLCSRKVFFSLSNFLILIVF